MTARSGSLRVLDASALINLLAVETVVARAILGACGGAFVITDEVAREVLRDPRDPSQPVSIRLAELSARLIDRVSLGPTLADRFVELTMKSMGDGEASVLAYAEAANGIAVIDDNDGRSALISVDLEWSIDLFLHARTRGRIAEKQVADAVYDAGRLARMRFPIRCHGEAIALIGEERARQCPGLRRAFRRSAR